MARDEVLKLRVSADEKEAMQRMAAAAGLPVSVWMRERIFEGSGNPPPVRAIRARDEPAESRLTIKDRH